MNHIAWVHANCSFSALQRRELWAFLSELEDAPLAMVREAGPAGPVAAPAATGVSQWDIVVVGNQDIGLSQDPRPFLVTRVLGGGMYEVCPITSQFGLGGRWTNPGDFQISNEHPEFNSTSLKKPSIVLDRSMVVGGNAIKKKVGRLSGNLLRDYLDHTGR